MQVWSFVVSGLISVFAVGMAWRAARAARRREASAVESARRSEEIKNEFVSMVSHELRTPLTSIAGFAESLRDSWSELDPHEVDEFLAIISSQSGFLSDLVEDVLVIPRIDAGRLQLEPEAFDLTDLVHKVASLMFPPAGGREASVAMPAGVVVYADPRRAQQVIRNILDNARKHGGDQILIEGSEGAVQYRVSVSDNGPGIPQGDEERIFEHFEQLTKGDARTNPGIGLGLPIARKLARAMGGDLRFERRFPTGSRFVFAIPVSAEPEFSELPEAAAELS